MCNEWLFFVVVVEREIVGKDKSVKIDRPMYILKRRIKQKYISKCVKFDGVMIRFANKSLDLHKALLILVLEV